MAAEDKTQIPVTGGIEDASYRGSDDIPVHSLVCPGCRHEDPNMEPDSAYAHFEAVEINQGGNILHVGPRNAITRKQGEPVGRGSVVSVICRCEFGHRFKFELAFSKGQITAYATHIEATAENCDDDPPTFWRD